MKTMIRKLSVWMTGLTLLAAFALPGTAGAAGEHLDVVYSNTPLFSDANFYPGVSVTRTAAVTNPSSNGSDADLYVKAENTFSTGLAEVLRLVVTSSLGTYFDGTFEEFFALSSVDLETLSQGGTRTYSFTASLPSDTPQSYQGKTLGFDLIIGAEGMDEVPDSTGGGGPTNKPNPQYVPTGGPSNPPPGGPGLPPPGPFGVGGDPGLGGPGDGNFLGAGGSEEDEEPGVEEDDSLFEDLGEGALDQAAAVGLLGFFGQFTLECVSVFILILLLLALAWRIIEGMYPRDAADLRPFAERNRVRVAALVGVAAAIALLAYWFPCVRWATLIALLVFAAFIFWRDRAKRNK